VLGPYGPYLRIGREFSAGGGVFGRGDSSTLFRRERHRRRLVVRTDETENDAIRWQVTGRFKRPIE